MKPRHSRTKWLVCVLSLLFAFRAAAATRRGAEAYGLGRDLGTVETGKIADLLVLDGDPLQDVHNLRKIHLVLKSGEVVDRKSLPTVHVVDYYDPEAPWPF